MKDQKYELDAQVVTAEVEEPEGGTGKLRKNGERVWLAPALSRLMEPLLSGLGIELLAPGDRERATITVESFAADDRADPSTTRFRIEFADGRVHDAPDTHEQRTEQIQEAQQTEAQQINDAMEFEGPGLWAAASYLISHAFGVSPPLLTADAAMFAVIRAATRAGQVDSPVLVTGETGTGKELLVRLIHAASGREGGISSINCADLNDAALPSRSPLFSDSALSDSALKNPPDGAGRSAPVTETRLDELCSASRATLFLDQVSELSPASQGRALRAILRTGDYAAGDIRTGARLVSATNQPLGPMVSSGRFKRELYDRLAVLTLRVPPLRERRADIGLLAAGFLSLQAPRLSFMPAALRALSSYPFPGNVRELHNVVTRLAIMRREGAGEHIHASDVRSQLLGQSAGSSAGGASIWKSSPFDMRREMALQALMVCRGDRAAAARKLGISVRALQQHVASGAAPPASRGR